jgi:chemotaxis-related protein WspD
MRTLNSCWNQIGVWGDSSCTELQRSVHCRNCSVYSQAAADLLDRDVPDHYLDASTRHFAEEVETTAHGARSVVIFRIENEWLALATTLLKEICDLRPIHSLPHQRNPAVLGIVNVRGELLVCIALNTLLTTGGTCARAGQDRLARTRMLVANRNGERLVFPVDEVHGIHRFNPSQLGDAPATIARATSTFTRAMLQWQDKSVGVLDENLLFQSLKGTLP